MHSTALIFRSYLYTYRRHQSVYQLKCKALHATRFRCFCSIKTSQLFLFPALCIPDVYNTIFLPALVFAFRTESLHYLRRSLHEAPSSVIKRRGTPPRLGIMVQSCEIMARRAIIHLEIPMSQPTNVSSVHHDQALESFRLFFIILFA